ncbi:MAG TPA: TatD family hydrolase [Terriglobia bacterium]|jgi:TatD DNase family protein|nr:TatD family hydrolase [Terriglobia bacterium]
MTQFFVDSHCHLDDSRFDADRDEVIERARRSGVRHLLTVSGGAGVDDLASGVSIAARYDWIFTTAGIHPHEAKGAEPRHFEMLRRATEEPKVVAIGEIGLDYFYDHSPREVQKRVLIEQLQIAKEAKLPVVIHCRDAWADLREIIGQHWASQGSGGVLHCFTGSRDDAFKFLDWGFMISFAGNITFKKAGNLRDVAREVPLERLLIETDSPYLAPEPYRGKRNEPAYVVEVARHLAAVRGMPVEEFGAVVGRNLLGLIGVA